MSSVSSLSAPPVVASYCTTFLKPEMLHIYRQVTALRRYHTYVLTRERLEAERFPILDLEVANKRKVRKNFLRRFWLKHVRGLPAIYYRGEMLWLLRIVNGRKTDLMHIYFGHTGVHLLPFIQEWEKPCVVSFHGMDVQSRAHQPGYLGQLNELLQVAPLVLARSQSLVERLRALGCPPEKIRLNRTGIPLEQFPFTARTVPPDGAWHFVQACRLIEKKGLGTALRAFAEFRRTHPRAHFTLAGEGPMQAEVEGLIGELGLTGAVQLRGFLAQRELRALYEQAHVFVHPSEMAADQNQEGVPNAMLEAMATGLPVVATFHGGIPEAVAHERTGLLVPERDAAGLAAMMRRLTGDAEAYAAMGAAASESVRVEFEQARQIVRLEGYYDEARAIGSPITRAQSRARSTKKTPRPARKYHDPAFDVATDGRPGVAYLFERFPSYLQTFCYREIEALVQQKMRPLVFSIRAAEERQAGDFPLKHQVQYLPEDQVLVERVRRLREGQRMPGRVWDVFQSWGARGDKMRIYQAHYVGTALRRLGVQHVHAHFAGIAARNAFWMKQFFGIHYSLTAHANDVFCYDENLALTLEELVNGAEFVATESRFSGDFLRRKLPQQARKICEVYNGIHVPAESPPLESEQAPLILSVGRYIEKKGFGDLIAACALLKKRGLAFRCRIVGTGPLEEPLRAQIGASGLAGEVELTGPCNEREVRALLAEARVFALACATESDGGMDNLPTVIMEAMAASRAVVSTRLAAVPEMVRDGETGFLTAEHDVPALAAALERLLGDRELAARMGGAGRTLAAERFASAKTARLLKQLLVRRGRASLPRRAWGGELALVLPSLINRMVGNLDHQAKNPAQKTL